MGAGVGGWGMALGIEVGWVGGYTSAQCMSHPNGHEPSLASKDFRDGGRGDAGAGGAGDVVGGRDWGLAFGVGVRGGSGVG